jgi:hypothetical protein
MPFGCGPHGGNAENIIKGKVMASPSPSCGEFCESELPVVSLSTKSA